MRIASGYWPPVTPRLLPVYPALGAVTGIAIGGGARRAAIWTPFGLYAVAAFEKPLQAALPSSGLATALLAGIASLGAYLAVGRIVASRWPGSAAAPLMLALAASWGLAVNRHLHEGPLDPGALQSDAAIALGLLAALRALRSGARRATVLVAAAGLLAGLPVLPTLLLPAPAPPEAPSLLLVIVDTLRADVFEKVCSDTDEGREFAEALGGSTWFDRTMAVAPWTCPSVGTIMTGLHPAAHGFLVPEGSGQALGVHRMADSVPTLAATLAARGYQTQAVSTNPFLAPGSGVERGFHAFEPLAGAGLALPLLAPFVRCGLLEDDPHPPSRCVVGRAVRHLERLMARRRAFFYWIHVTDPHIPLRQPRGLSDDPGGASLPRSERIYRDEVRDTLRQLTRLLRFIEASSWPTAVLITSDHGEAFPSDRRTAPPPPGGAVHGHGHHLYGELLHVPLVIRPTRAAGAIRRSSHLVSLLDVFATCLDVLEVEGPPSDGVSLVPWLRDQGPADAPRRLATAGFLSIPGVERALITPEWKLIQRQGRGTLELYDIRSDPRERADLAVGDPSRAADAASLLDESWPARVARSEPLHLDEDTRERLRMLGYIQ